MIRSIEEKDIPECAAVIRTSFMTVAEEFGLTQENAPRFTAFATTQERLERQFEEGRPMFAYMDQRGKIVGYYSLHILENKECELNNLCVLAVYRHRGIGKELIEHAFSYAKRMGCRQMSIGIV